MEQNSFFFSYGSIAILKINFSSARSWNTPIVPLPIRKKNENQQSFINNLITGDIITIEPQSVTIYNRHHCATLRRRHENPLIMAAGNYIHDSVD